MKKYLALALTPFLFTACSSNLFNQDVNSNSDLKVEVLGKNSKNKLDLLSIKDGTTSDLRINIVGNSCKVVKGSDLQILSRINKMNSTLNDKLELETKVEATTYQKGYEYSFEYCRQEDQSLILTIDYTKYSENAFYQNDVFVPDMHNFKSKIRILPNSPFKFSDLTIEYITE